MADDMNIPRSGCGGPVIPGDTALRNLIKKIGKGPKLSEDLTREEARAALTQILDGTAAPAQIGAFLIALRMKGESADEITGMTEALRGFSLPLKTDFPKLLELAPAHDGKTKTLVLSPFVAAIIACAGMPVVVTGALDVPTKKGVTPRSVFAALGVPYPATPEKAAHLLLKTGITYYDAAVFCPALEKLKPLRDCLGLRTPLNTVEKLIRPSNATHLCTGIFHGPYLQNIAEAARALGYPNVLALQATEASTDLPLKKRVLYRQVRDGILSEQLEIDPAPLGYKRETNPEFLEINATTNVTAVMQAILEKSGLIFDALTYNAGAQLWFTGESASIHDGIRRAEDILKSGAVVKKISELAEASR